MTTATAKEPTVDDLIDEATNKPVSTGKHFGLDFALFKNTGKTGNPFYSLNLTKSFKRGDGDYEDRKVSLLLREWPIVRAHLDQLYAEGLGLTFKDNRK